MNIEAANIIKALGEAGKDKNFRDRMTDLCLELEKKADYPNSNIRNEVTGYIVDAIHSRLDFVNKRLENGITFEFAYSSKIAREFVLSHKKLPDHVWEPQTTKLLLLLSKGASNVLIGGAYFGDHAILIANQIAANKGICHTFEPNRLNSKMLRRNAEINHLSNIIINEIGLWNTDGANLEFVGGDALASSNEIEDKSSDSFESTTIDSYLAKKGIEKLDLLMIDIEGGELHALQGAKNQLALPKAEAPNIVFEIHSLYTDWSNGLENTDIIKYVSSFGYKVFAIRDIHSNYDLDKLPIELTSPDRTYIEGPPHGFNMLAVKDESVLQTDDFRLCYDVSPKYLFNKNSPLFSPLA